MTNAELAVKLKTFLLTLRNLSVDVDIATTFCEGVLTEDKEFRDFLILHMKGDIAFLQSIVDIAEDINKEEQESLPANVIPFRKVR